MTKLLLFVFGTVVAALECVDGKMWNYDDGDDHSDETLRIFLWIARIKRLSLIAFMLLSVLLYYIPESRSHVRRACCFLIDLIADGLKFALSATESDSERKMKFKRRTFLNDHENHSRKRNYENNKINDKSSRYQKNTRTRSRRYVRDQDEKSLNRHRDYQRYREIIPNDVKLKNCFKLAPFLQNQHQQNSNTYPVRITKDYDQMIDHTFNHQDDLSYMKQKFVVGYAENYEPNDPNLSTNYYKLSNERYDRNVPNISSYQHEIVGDNQFYTDKDKLSMEGFKGDDNICKRKILGIRQMHGDTIQEMSYNESSYTSLEAEADDENSQCGNEIAMGMKFLKEINPDEIMTMSTSMGGYHSSSSSDIFFPSKIIRFKRRSYV